MADWLSKSAKGKAYERLQMKAKAKFETAPEGGKKKESSTKRDNGDY